MANENAAIKIVKAFKEYVGNMNNVWEEYSYLSSCVYNSKHSVFYIKGLFTNENHNKTIVDAGGMQTRFKQGGNTRSHFLDSIGLFENYISFITKTVYKSYPKKMGFPNMNDKKMLDIIIDSSSKEMMLDKIIEEKVRGIFYGNSKEIFTKDKCNIGCENIFNQEKYAAVIEMYSEIIGRRNLIVHNNGRVDKKYLRENKNSKFNENKKIIISDNYLRGSISLLIGLAALYTNCVVKEVYNGDCTGKLQKSLKAFERAIENSWYESLLK